MNSFKILVMAFIIACASTTLASPKEFLLLKMAERKELKSRIVQDVLGVSSRDLSEYKKISGGTREFALDQKIDYSDETSTTYTQRFWVNSSYAKVSDAPVFIWLCGEWTCSGEELSRLFRYAREAGGHMVAIEHRYYGKSHPFPRLTAENLRFLKTEFALEDAARIHRHIQKQMGLSGKAIIVGGSYSASLAAYYRMKYPDLVAGAWASSGPVQAKEAFEEYDFHVAKVVGPACGDAMRSVVKRVEASLSNPTELAQMKKKFAAEELTDDVDFLYSLADMGALAAQYGYRDEFCDMLTNTSDPLEAYAEFTRKIYSSWGITAKSFSVAGSFSENPDDYIDTGMRSWYYQSCTEYGYWQVAYHDLAITVRSPRIDLAYHRNICKRLFGLEVPVDTTKVNETLYKPLLDSATSQIFFTNGSRDPWSTLSIAKELGNDTNLNTVAMTIEGAAHCDDLRNEKPSDSDALKSARDMASQLFGIWLR